jgi:hypothetical protein
MARREYFQKRNTFGLYVRNPTDDLDPPPLPQISPIERIVRSVHSMKRFFSSTKPKETDASEKPKKKARRDNVTIHRSEAPDPCFTSKTPFTNRFAAPLDRTRRNGMIFDDITVWANQDASRSNTLPTRKRNTLTLANVDFTRPPPEWFTQAFVQSPPDGQLAGIDLHVPLRDLNATVNVDRTSYVPQPVIDFMTVSEFRAIKDTCATSISSLPPTPGYLQETLFNHALMSLATIVTCTEESAKLAWRRKHVCMPSHFTDAMQFLASSCKKMAQALTFDATAVNHVSQISALLVHIVSLVVRIANAIDAAEGANVLKDVTRAKCVKKLSRALDIIITASSQFPIDAETTLELIGELLSNSAPSFLLASRFRVYQNLIDATVQKATDRILAELAIPQRVFERLERFISIVKRTRKQLDRIAVEESIRNDTYSLIVEMINLKHSMLKAFHNAFAAKRDKDAYAAFQSASEFAQRTAEPHVQAECLYRMAVLLINRGQVSGRADPKVLLMSARRLNPSESFQTKVLVFLDDLRRETLSSILRVAATIIQEYHPARYVEGLKMFAFMLLTEYPTPGLDRSTVLSKDVGKGMLKLVRAFHPDKNTYADEERRLVCEDITKVLHEYEFADDRR